MALGFAIAHLERVASLVLIDPLVIGQRWAERIVELRAMLAQGDQAWRTRQRWRRLTTIETLVNDTTLEADLWASKPPSAEELSAVTRPVLAIYGAESDFLHHGYRLGELLPQCTLTVLPGCTHAVLRKASAAVRDILLAWLSLEPAELV